MSWTNQSQDGCIKPICVYNFKIPDNHAGEDAHYFVKEYFDSEEGMFVLSHSVKNPTISQTITIDNYYEFNIFAYFKKESHICWELRYK